MGTKQELKFLSLNVNGLGNPVKRAKVMAKLKKERTHINFLQETHLSKVEHEKLKRFGFKNTFYSSHVNARKRGVAILMSNVIKFECQKEIADREGTYIIVKGKIGQTMITLVNIYAPPESNKTFFKNLLDIITVEAEGICICGGDLNVLMDPELDTTSLNRNKLSIINLVKTSWEEMGFFDVWRDLHPLQRDFSHYSKTHSIYSRIDYFFAQKEHRDKIQDCRMGVADVSDHNAIYLKIHLDCRRRDTIWRLNEGILNNKTVVEQIRTDIRAYMEENDNGETDPAILWDALKAVIRGRLIAITSHLKRERLKQYKTHVAELRSLEQTHKGRGKVDQKIQQQINEVRNKINNLLQHEVETKMRYLKQSYYESGPKSMKLLARRLRKQQAETTINKIHDPKTDLPKYDPKDIENIFMEYYRKLYTQSTVSDQNDVKSFLDSLDLPSIGTTQNDQITAEITEDEICKAIGKLKTNKAPGSDGFPCVWYKKFGQELIPLLRTTFNWIMTKGTAPPSWSEAIISVIPKPLKDREFCQNYRPISVLNVDYKIYTSIISKRIQTFIPDLIDEDQSGFVRNRQTQDNIRRTLHIIHKIHKDNIPAALISLDAEKAFDRVDWEFLYLTLEKFGFSTNSIQCIKSIYNKPTARVKVNGSLSERFALGRGTRQGCCLSPTLFALYIEPLAQMIRQDISIQGIEINKQKHVISLFADDIMIYLKEPLYSFTKLTQILEKFSLYSGYKVNILKTQVLMFNSPPNQELREWKIDWDAKSIKYLGINITKDLNQLYKYNYDDINRNIREDIERWSTYPLGLNDRVNVIKMNILPRLLYVFQSLPVNVPKHQFSKWDKCISRFLWEGKRPRVRYTTLQISKDKGGLALPNLREYFHAAQLRHLIFWCNEGYVARWKDIEVTTPKSPLQTYIGETEISTYEQNENDTNPVVLFTLDVWYSTVKRLKIGKEIGLLKWIAFDDRFIPGKYDSSFKHWTGKGITAVCTATEKGEMKSFQQLKNKHDLTNQDLFRYLQVRDYFIKQIKTNEDETHPIVKLIAQAYNKNIQKPVSVLYHCLMTSKRDSTLYLKSKWERELGEGIPEGMWYEMVKTHQTTSQSLIWREFNWKNLIRYFITPNIKSKQMKVQQPCWRLCNHVNSDHTHVFWKCTNIQPFWRNVYSVLCEVLGYKIPNSCLVLYLGHLEGLVHKEDQYLVKILLAAGKKAITKNWLRTDTPNDKQWMLIIDGILEMERLTYKLRLKEHLFLRDWGKWLTYRGRHNQ